MTEYNWPEWVTEEQKTAWCDAVKELNSFSPFMYASEDPRHWDIVWIDMARGTRKNLRAYKMDGDGVALVLMDIYSNYSTTVMRGDIIHDGLDEECGVYNDCDYCRDAE